MDEQVINKGFQPNPTVEQLLSCEVKFKSSWPMNPSPENLLGYNGTFNVTSWNKYEDDSEC
jgi:hypothetical protein